MLAAVATRPSRFAGATRRKLWCGTALAMCLSAAGPAFAQGVLPVVSPGGTGGATIVRDPSTGTMSVDVDGASRIVRYDSFDLGTSTSSSETLTFLNSGAAGSYSVLNRISSPGGSTIYGSISAPSNMTIWLVDPQGVTFGPTGSFSGGGLIVSTALLNAGNETDFLAGNLNTLSGASTKPIIFQTGTGAISASGSIVVVGQQISVNRTLTSSSGTVALVAATDVSFANINSPLSFTVTRGTTLATGVAVGANGNISGQSIRLAVGGDSLVTASLLQVNPGAVITATAANGSIVLATDTVGTVGIVNGGGPAPELKAYGTLQASGANADVLITGAELVDFAGSISAGRDITLSSTGAAAGSVTAGGSIAAGRNYAASARNVTLGTAATTVTQAAGGSSAVNATNGNILGQGNLTLQSNSNGSGAETLGLTATGLIDLGAASSLIGGTVADRSNVLLTSGSSIVAGNVTALALLRSGNPTDLTLPGNLTLGNVTTVSDLRLTSAGGTIQTGDLTSTGAIRLDAQAAGDVVAGTANAANAIDLLARNNIRLVSAGSTTGSIALSAQTGSVSGATLPAPINDGRPLPNFGRATLTAGAANQTITVAANAGTAQLGALSAGTGAGALGANQIQVSAATVDVTSANAVNGHVDLESAGGTIRAGALSAGSATAASDVIVNAPAGAVTVDGAVSASRDYRVTGSAVTLGANAATVSQTANGAVTIRANTGNVTGLGALTVQANRDGGGAEALYLNAAGAGGVVNFAAGSQLLGGTPAQRSAVQITSAPSLTLGSVTASSLLTFGNATDLVSNGSITTGAVTVDQSLRIVSATGSITTGNIQSTAGAIRLDAQAAGDVVAGTVNAANAIDLLAQGNIRLVSAGSTTGSIALSAQTGSVSGAALPAPINDGRPLPNFGRANLTAGAANQTVTVTANAGTAQLGTLSAGAGAGALGADQVSVSAGSIDLNDATAVNGNIHLAAGSGNLRAGALSAGTPTILADVVVSASGTATLEGNVSASRDYLVSASDVTLGAIGVPATQRAGRLIDIGATDDILAIAGLQLNSDLDINVHAIDAVTVEGGVLALRDYSVTGASVTLGGTAPATQRALGLLTVTATGGNATGLDGLTLHSDLDVIVGATGAATVRGAVTAQRDYKVTGASVALGGAAAVTQSAVGTVAINATGGDVLSAANLTLHSDLDTTVSATGAATISGNVTALGAYSVTGSNVTLGGLTAPAVTQSAGGLLTVTATAGDVSALPNLLLKSDLDVIVGATGTATLQSAVSAAGDYRVTASSVTLGNAGASVTQSAGGAVEITATGSDIRGLDALTLQAKRGGSGTGALTLNAAKVVNFDPSSKIFGGVEAGPAAARSDIIIRSTPWLKLGKVTGLSLHTLLNPSALTATGPVEIGAITVDQALAIVTTGGSISTGAVTVEGSGNSLSLTAGGGTSNLTTGILLTNGGNIGLTAGNDINVASASTASSGTPVAGTIAMLAGGNILSTTLVAGEDLALTGNGGVTFTTASAGDDVDIATNGTVSFVSLTSTGTGAGHDIAIRAAALVSPVAMLGDTDLGLVVRSMTGGAHTLGAAQGDIRISSLDADGNIDIATQGSISGLRTGWIATSGGATIATSGDVILEGVGAANFAIGSVTASTVSTAASAPDTLRLGTVRAGSLNLTAGRNLQIDDAQITGTASLHTTAGTAGAFNLTSASLVAGYGRADLNGADILVTANGAAQLGTVLSDQNLGVTAAALDLLNGTATLGALSLQANSGRLTLGTGIAGTTASLVKEDANIGVPKTAAENLLTAGNVTAGGAASFRSQTGASIGTAAAGSGDLTINAATDATIGTGTANSGAIRILASHDIAATTLTATAEDIALRAGNNATLGTLVAGDNLDLVAGGALTIASGTTLGTGADNRSFVFDPALAGQAGAITVGATPASDGDIRLLGGSVALGAIDSAVGNVGITATAGDVSTIPASSGLVTARGAGKTITVAATNGDVQLGPLNAGQGGSTITGAQITVTATTIDIQSATATNGALALTATDGGLQLGTGTAGTSATLVKQGTTGELSATSLTAAQDIAIQSQTSARLGAVKSNAGSIGVLAQAEVTGTAPAGTGANLDAFEDLGVSAGGNVRLAAVRAGDDIGLGTSGDINLVSAITDGSAGDTRAIAFDRTQIGQAAGITFGAAPAGSPQAPAGSNILIRAASLGGPAMTGDTDTGLVIGTLGSGAATLSSAQGDIRADALTATSGDIAATATRGSVTGRRTGFQAGAGGSTITARGQLTLDVSGSVTAGAVTAGGAVTNAGGAATDSIRLRSVNAGTLTLTAATNLQVDSGTVTGTATLGTTGGTVGAFSPNGTVAGYGSAAMTAQAAGKTITVDAFGAAQLGVLDAGQGSGTAAGNQLTIRGSGVRLGAAHARNGDILIETKNGLALLGAVDTVDAARSVTIRNNGTGGTIVGGTTADGGTDVALDDAEMDLISSGNVVIDSKAQGLTIDRLTIAAGTGRNSLRLLTTGAINLTDAISGDGTGVLQIGGSSTADPAGLVDETKLATQLKANIGDSGTKAAILLPNGTVDLRARKIVFARPTLIDKYLPASGTSPSNAAVALDVANAASELYTADGTGRQFLTAKRLKVSYSNFALFQNTAAASGGGVVLNEVSPPSITTLALQLFSTGDRGDNSFALFGHINGFIGRAAGILPNDSLEIWDVAGNPRVTRISQGNSRVNGCVIGSPDKGCLVNDPPRPNFSIYDQRQTQLFSVGDDPLLFFNPLVGRGNEGLIVDIADAPVGIDTIECDPTKGPCSPEGPK